MRTKAWWLSVLVGCLAACGAPAAEDEGLPPDVTSGDERPSMSAEECEQQGGTVVGDIGDGAVHRSDYVCPSGGRPIGSVPLGVEGSVCCPAEG